MIPENIIQNWTRHYHLDYRVITEHDETKIILIHRALDESIAHIAFVTSERGSFVDVVARPLTFAEFRKFQSVMQCVETLMQWHQRQQWKQEQV
jgi:hypothetical protein